MGGEQLRAIKPEVQGQNPLNKKPGSLNPFQAKAGGVEEKF